MKTYPIIPELNVPGNILTRLLPRRVDGPVHALNFQRSIERLGESTMPLNLAARWNRRIVGGDSWGMFSCPRRFIGKAVCRVRFTARGQVRSRRTGFGRSAISSIASRVAFASL